MITLALIMLCALPPCQTEDSRNCHWQAESRGNGQGASFVDIGGVMFRLSNPL